MLEKDLTVDELVEKATWDNGAERLSALSDLSERTKKAEAALEEIQLLADRLQIAAWNALNGCG